MGEPTKSDRSVPTEEGETELIAVAEELRERLKSQAVEFNDRLARTREQSDARKTTIDKLRSLLETEKSRRSEFQQGVELRRARAREALETAATPAPVGSAIRPPELQQKFLDVVVDPSLLDRMQKDAGRDTSSFAMAPQWQAVEAEVDADTPDTEALLRAWLGVGNLRAANDDEIDAYRDFFSSLSIGAPELGAQPTLGDLGTIHDLVLIDTFAKESVRSILEIGGGYGRLAEALLTSSSAPELYVLVDAVPSSLCYAAAYLDQHLDGVDVRLHTEPTPLPEDASGVVVVPSWHVESAIEHLKFDVAINVASFQEMSAATVTSYIDLIDNHTADNAIFYGCNSRDYPYPQDIMYPPEWEVAYLERTPRAKTLDYPSEILRLHTGSAPDAQNNAARVQYLSEMTATYRRSYHDERLGQRELITALRQIASRSQLEQVANADEAS